MEARVARPAKKQSHLFLMRATLYSMKQWDRIRPMKVQPMVTSTASIP